VLITTYQEILFIVTMFIGAVFFVVLATTAFAADKPSELTLPPLPYAYNALEPVLSEHLMRLHHLKHHQTYMTKVNIALKAMEVEKHGNASHLAKEPIEVILTQLQNVPDQYRMTVRNNGGGFLNHKLFFAMLKAPTGSVNDNKPTGRLLEMIETSFGSFDKFKELFSVACNNFFGSGWIWLYIDAATNKLVLNFTINQDNPIMFDKHHVVLLGIDLWEHAYYPVYENRRNEYIDNFWRIVNWPFVADLLAKSMDKRNEL